MELIQECKKCKAAREKLADLNEVIDPANGVCLWDDDVERGYCEPSIRCDWCEGRGFVLTQAGQVFAEMIFARFAKQVRETVTSCTPT